MHPPQAQNGGPNVIAAILSVKLRAWGFVSFHPHAGYVVKRMHGLGLLALRVILGMGETWD